MFIYLPTNIVFLERIIVATGYPFEDGKLSEVIYLADNVTKCKPLQLKNFSMRAGSSGGVIDNHLIVCGGYFEHETKTKHGKFKKIESYSSCNAFGHENWTQISMLETKWHASSIVLNPSTLWVTGGENDGFHLCSTEFITLYNDTSQRGIFL